MKRSMNKWKIITILGGILIIQIVALILLYSFSFQKRKFRLTQKPLIKNFKAEDVKGLEISDYQDAFSIEKKDDYWFVKIGENYIPGDESKITSYLEIVKNLKHGVIVDKGNKENYKHFRFDSEQSQKVKIIMNDDSSIVIHIGSAGSKQGTSYIRFNEENKIREIDSFISSETSNKPVLWAKRKIFDGLALEDIERCEIESYLDWFKGNYAIQYKEIGEKKSENYVLDPPLNKKIKDYALANIIVNILQLLIDDYKLDGSINTENTEVANIKLMLKTGKNYNMKIFKAGENDPGDYIIKVDFTKFLYIVDENDLKLFIKSTDELIDEEK